MKKDHLYVTCMAMNITDVVIHSIVPALAMRNNMKQYTVWFIGISKGEFINAPTRKMAIALFAAKNLVNTLGYIQARLSTSTEKALGSMTKPEERRPQ